MEWKTHGYRAGSHSVEVGSIPADRSELEDFTATARKNIEPWLSAVVQAEHLNLLIGSGFTTSIAGKAGGTAAAMGTVKFGTKYDAAIEAHATASARSMHRGAANVEDQFRSALAVLEGFEVTDAAEADTLKAAMDAQLRAFLLSVLATERSITAASANQRAQAEAFLQSFLLSFASRAASRERLHIFTTNYDRLIEHGADLAGLRIVDRFVGALSPIFRSSRVEVDLHYNPPGIRGEPRFHGGRRSPDKATWLPGLALRCRCRRHQEASRAVWSTGQSHRPTH